MIQKHGKWFADWFDAQGHRRRKAFATKKKALAHQKKQRLQSQQHATRPTRPRTQSPKPTRTRTKRARRTRQRSNSPKRSEARKAESRPS
jgi:hypothetical protein